MNEEIFGKNHPFWDYFNKIHHHETAAMLYLADTHWTIHEEEMRLLRKILKKKPVVLAPRPPKESPTQD